MNISVTQSVVHTTTIDITKDPAYAAFIEIISQVRNHILHSSQTQAIYTQIVETFWHLGGPRDRPCPTGDDVLRYFSDHFPKIVCHDMPGNSWGMVEKDSSANEVKVNSKLAVAVGNAASNPSDFHFPPSYFSFMLAITVFHGLCHALTKHFFGQERTPSIQTCNKPGENEWFLEEYLIGGFVIVQWHQNQKFKMEALKALEFEPANAPDTYYKMSDSAVEAFLASLSQDHLSLPDPNMLQLSSPMRGTDSHATYCRVGADVSGELGLIEEDNQNLTAVRFTVGQDRF